MLDSNDLYNSIKLASLKALESSKPSDFLFGKVISVSPLKISVEQKMTLGSAQLILTRNVTNYALNVTVGFNTEESNEHSHNIQGMKTVVVHNGLNVGDEVILLRKKGGQKYLILDKVVNA